MKVYFFLLGLPLFLSTAPTSTQVHGAPIATHEECHVLMDDVGVGICEDYFVLDCHLVNTEDCDVLEDLYRNETGMEPDWYGARRLELMTKLRGSTTTTSATTISTTNPWLKSRDLLGIDDCKTPEMTGKQRGMCMGYHIIRRNDNNDDTTTTTTTTTTRDGHHHVSCCEDPDQTPCSKIQAKYMETFNHNIPGCGNTNNVIPSTSPPTASPTTTPPTSPPTSPPTAPPKTTPPTAPPTSPPTAPPKTTPPTSPPTSPPTARPTSPPTARPTSPPTVRPTSPPTASPTTTPPTSPPTSPPTVRPTSPPTASPTTTPPTSPPTSPPTARPTSPPTASPTTTPPTSPPTPPPPAAVETLEEAILKDMFAESSSSANCGNHATVSTFAFQQSPSGTWYNPFVDLEQHVFQAEMQPLDSTTDQQWKLKFGQAGNIYSYETAVGETVPPQEHDNAPWIDEVWQAVSVDGSENVAANTCFDSPWFIHEAGAYTYDSSCAINPTSPTDTVKAPYVDAQKGTLDDYGLTRGSQPCDEEATRFKCLLDNPPNFGNYPQLSTPLVELKGEEAASSVIVDFLHMAYSNGNMYFTSSNTLEEINAALPQNQRIFAYQHPDPVANDIMGGPAMGGYGDATDLRDVPFYSPSLGKYCDDASGECYFMSWGQQAHVPTSFTSGMLYFNRYKNCGGGVFEHTTMRHLSNGDPYQVNYMNVPWGAIRTSALPEVMVTKTDGTNEHVANVPWGTGCHHGAEVNSVNTIRNIDDTGGYIMFRQNTASDLDIRPTPLCPEDANLVGLPYVYDGTDSAYTAQTLNDIGPFTRDGNACQLQIRAQGNRFYCGLTAATPNLGLAPNEGFSTPRNVKLQVAGSTSAPHVIAGFNHYNYVNVNNVRRMYFYSYNSLDEVRVALPANAVLNITYGFDTSSDAIVDDTAIAVENTYGVGHIYGTNPFNPEGRPSTRMRWGFGSRDFTVYTLNSFARVHPGDTYSFRQYFMADKFSNLPGTGQAWKDQAQEKLIQNTASITGRSIYLYKEDGGSTFGSIVDEGTCGNAVLACTGSTTPTSTAYKPLFQIKCGSSTAVTHDPYHFAPNGNGEWPAGVKLPYICHGMGGARPQYKLLGFFTEGSCASSIGSGHVYEESFCHSITI